MKTKWFRGVRVCALACVTALCALMAISDALLECRADGSGRPRAVIVNTQKGNRVPGLEGAALSHVTGVRPDLIDELLGPNA